MSRSILALTALSGLLLACGGDSTTEPDLAHALTDQGVPDLASSDGAVTPDMALSVDAAGMSTLMLQNYLAWCTVSVNGAATSTSATQMLTVPTGSVITLSGDKAPGATFVWGYWRGTAGDTTAAHDTMKATTVTMSGNKTVQACCPFAASPSTPCPDPT